MLFLPPPNVTPYKPAPSGLKMMSSGGASLPNPCNARYDPPRLNLKTAPQYSSLQLGPSTVVLPKMYPPTAPPSAWLTAIGAVRSREKIVEHFFSPPPATARRQYEL